MTVLDRIKIVLEGDTVKLTKSLQGAQRAMEQAGKKMENVGKTMSTRLTLPLVGIGGASVKIAADFDATMRKIVGLVGIAEEQVNDWRTEVRHLAVDYASSASAAGDALFFITSAGLRGANAMEALKISLMASAAGLGEVKTVASAATYAMNAYASVGLTATRATEILTAGIRMGSLEADQLAPVMGRLTGTASALQISFEDVVGTLAVFSRTGTDAAEGATQLLSIMSSLLGTSKEGEEALEGEGLSLEMLRDTVAKPGGLLQVMRLLNTAFEGNQAALKMVIPNLRAFRGVMNALAQDAESVDEVMRGTADSVGIVREAFEAAKGPLFEMHQAWERVKEGLLTLGNAVIPVVVPLIVGLGEAVEDAAEWFDALSPTMQKTVVVTLGLTAAMGPLLVAMGTLLKLVGTIQFVKLTTGFASFSRLLLPGGVALVGLGLITAAFVHFKQKALEAEAAMLESTEKMKASFGLLSPEAAARRVERFNAVIARLQGQVDDMRQEVIYAKVNMGELADVTATRATPAFASSRAELQRKADAVQETIDRMTEFRDVLVEVAKVPPIPGPVDTEVTPVPYVNTIKTAVEELNKGLRAADDFNDLLGDSFDLTAARMEAYKGAIESLVGAGVPLNTVLNEQGMTLQDLAEMFRFLEQRTNAANEAQAALTAAQQEAVAITESVITPTEQYGRTLEKLEEYLEEGLITQETFDRAMAEARKELEGVTDAANDLGRALAGIASRGAQNLFNRLLTGSRQAQGQQQHYNAELQRLRDLLNEGVISQEAFNVAVHKAHDATQDLSDSFESWGDVAKDVIGDIIEELQRLSIKLAVMKLFESLGVQVAGYEHGGYLPAGRLGLVGEAGPELIQAGRSGVTVKPMHGMSFAPAMASGPAPQISVNINAVDARSFADLAEANPAAIAGPFLQALQRSERLRGALR